MGFFGTKNNGRKRAERYMGMASKYFRMASDGVTEPNMIAMGKAFECAKKAIELDPKPGYYYSLGIMYSVTGNYEDAKRSYEKVLELDPNLETPEIRKGIEGDPKVEMHLYLGDASYKSGNIQIAIKEYKEVLKLDENCKEAKDFLSKVALSIKLHELSSPEKEKEPIPIATT